MGGSVFFWEWEEVFSVWLQNLGSGVFTNFLVLLNNFFSFLGEEYVAVLVLGMVYWGIDKKKGERIGLAVLSSMVCNNLIKNRFKRLRPWQSSDKIELLRDVDGFSFPSAHSSSATSLYPTLASEFKEKKWLRTVAVVVPLLIGLSRCFLGAHWATDVIVGLVLGLVFYGLIELIMPRIKNKYILYAIFLGVGAIGFFYCTTEDYFTGYGLISGFVASMFFEEKVVKFENTRKITFIILRTVCGGGAFVLSNLLFKPVFDNIFAEGAYGALIMRTIRYALVSFVTIGVYPMAFKPVERFIQKKINVK